MCALCVCHQPFYGGKVHRVTAEVKNTISGASLCKVAGEWNGALEFTYADVSDSAVGRVYRCESV